MVVFDTGDNPDFYHEFLPYGAGPDYVISNRFQFQHDLGESADRQLQQDVPGQDLHDSDGKHLPLPDHPGSHYAYPGHAAGPAAEQQESEVQGSLSNLDLSSLCNISGILCTDLSRSFRDSGSGQ